MKCFIHGALEAVAACKTCGKGMCSNCSAYSGHTGICPACRLKEFETKYEYENSRKKGIIGKMIFWGVLAVAGLFIYPIVSAVPGLFLIINCFKIGDSCKKIKELQAEIDKLRKALTQGRASI